MAIDHKHNYSLSKKHFFVVSSVIVISSVVLDFIWDIT
jgi:hypothetical protein